MIDRAHPGYSPARLATLYAAIGAGLTGSATRSDVLEALMRATVLLVPGAEQAAITRCHSGVDVLAAAGDQAARISRIQCETGTDLAGSAPNDSVVIGDLPTNARWPEFGRRVFEATGVRSLLSLRLNLGRDDALSGLHIYSSSAGAFDDEAQILATLLATHCSQAILADDPVDHGSHLASLAYNRDIGVAMGVLMNEHGLNREQAFDLLKIASQYGHRNMHEIAMAVCDNGTVDLPGRGASNQHAGRSVNDLVDGEWVLHALALVESGLRTREAGQRDSAWRDLVVLISEDAELLLPALLTVTLRIASHVDGAALQKLLDETRAEALHL